MARSRVLQLLLPAALVLAELGSRGAAVRGQVYGSYGYAWGRGGGYHASTAAEGYGRGLADVVRAQGEYNLSTSEAMINVEEARKAYIENRTRATEAYFQQRRINEVNRESKRYEQRQQTSEWVRKQKEKPPRRLMPEELDPFTGEIHWPTAFSDADYRSLKVELERLFHLRAEQSPPLNAADASAARKAITSLSDSLKQNFSQTEPTDFTLALRFIDGLKSEVRLPPR